MQAGFDVVEGLEDGGEDVDITHRGTGEEQRFDETVGMLEEVLLDNEFVTMQQTFLDKWADQFEDSDENKLLYTDVFTQWTEMVEGHVEERLKDKMPHFEMETFFKAISEKDEADITGDVFDMLLSLGEFSEFKALMMAHKGGAALGGGMELVGEPPACNVTAETLGGRHSNVPMRAMPS